MTQTEDSDFGSITIRVSPRREVTLSEVLISWQSAVSYVRGSVEGTLESEQDVFNEHDYVGSLFTRGFIETALVDAGDVVASAIEKTVDPFDSQFVDLTEPGFSARLSRVAFGQPGQGWWWDRAPRSGHIREAIDGA